MEYGIGIAIGVVGGFFFTFLIAFVRAGGIGPAFQGLTIAGQARVDPAFAAKLKQILTGQELKPAKPPAPPKPSGAPLRMLSLLQAEARLVDFLLEDIQSASDEQIGQAVREVHKKSQAALRRHAVIETVLPGKEDDTVTVQKGFDPAIIRVVGNVTGEPPFTGQIQHPGWRVKELKLTQPAAGVDEFVIQPAEVRLP